MSSTDEPGKWDLCDHCKGRGELGPKMRAHAVDVPGKTYRVVRLLHVEHCTDAWFAKYNEWLAKRK